MAIYAKFEGIRGSVTDKKYEHTIEISSYEIDTHRKMFHQLGKSNRTIGNIQHSTLTLTKHLDAASTDLLQYFYKAKCIPSVTFYHVTETSPSQCYMERKLSNVLIGRVDESNEPNGSFEEIELIFSAIEKRVTMIDAQNKAASPKTVSFDPSK